MDSVQTNNKPIIGEIFEGGYFAGHIGIDGKTYALIVAPKTQGDRNGIAWQTDWLAPTPGAQSINDGLANSEAMNDSGHPAAQWCRSLDIGGYSDWYLPSRDELEFCYRNLKPTDDNNWTYENRAERWSLPSGKYPGVDDDGNGSNESSQPPGLAYAKADPGQTATPYFQDGGAEAFEDSWYWSSTEVGSAFAWIQDFVDGCQYYGHKYSHLRVRAVRKILI